MSHPKVSVIIPTYGGADYLGEAIASVLNQTWSDFELIVVNDASPDKTDEVVARFDDPRIKYIRHETNRGVANARRTGVIASTGEIIAHLDQDDFFHPEKLRIHVEFMDEHPEIGFTYNSRFELFPTSGVTREILRPSPELALADFVLSFPLAPSVWVQRREWVLKEEIWEEKTFYRGREIVICGRLHMAGCKFAMIDRVLNYRRYHRKRIVKNPTRACEEERTCQQIIFDDPRCPPDVLELKDVASSNIYAMWAYVAYFQKDFKTGKELLSQAVKLNPSLLEGTPPALVNDLIVFSIDDVGASHESVLKDMFENLPESLSALAKYNPWAVERGYLMQGVRAVMWDRPQTAQEYAFKVNGQSDQLDETFMQWLTTHLLAYESEYGNVNTARLVDRISQYLTGLGGPDIHHKVRGYYFVNRAYEKYDLGDYKKVGTSVLSAVVNNPANLMNKGLLSVFFHSIPMLFNVSGG